LTPPLDHVRPGVAAPVGNGYPVVMHVFRAVRGGQAVVDVRFAVDRPELYFAGHRGEVGVSDLTTLAVRRLRKPDARWSWPTILSATAGQVTLAADGRAVHLVPAVVGSYAEVPDQRFERGKWSGSHGCPRLAVRDTKGFHVIDALDSRVISELPVTNRRLDRLPTPFLSFSGRYLLMTGTAAVRPGRSNAVAAFFTVRPVDGLENACRLPGPTAGTAFADFSRDDTLVAALAGRELWVWDRDTTKPVSRTILPYPGLQIRFSAQGDLLFVAGGDDCLRAVDPSGGRVYSEFDPGIGKLMCVAVSADGTTAAVGSRSGWVAVWDVGP
jgi:hypothetical protein